MDSTPLAERAERDEPGEVLTPAHVEALQSSVDYHARRVAGLAPDPGSGVEDLRQDFLLDVLKALPQFDSRRASWATFANLRVRHAAWDRAGERFRKRKRMAQWLDDVVPEASPVQVDPTGEASTESLERSMDVERAIGALPAHLQRLCRMLQHEPPQVAQKKCGLSAAEYYRQRHEIGMRFRARGVSPPRPPERDRDQHR